MGIKKLFFETAIILILITLIVVTINSFQAHRNTSQDLQYLQKQYLNATFEIYKNEIIGDVLVDNKTIIKSLLNEITNDRGVGAILTYNNKTLSTGTFNFQSPVLAYKLNLGNEKFSSIKLYPLKNLKVLNFIDTLLMPLLLETLVLSVGFLWLLRRTKRKLLNPLNELVLNLETGNIEKFSPKVEAVIELKQLCNTLQKMTADLRKKAQYEAEAIAAKQVAHDIRSPLACLNLLLSYATALPENQRILMRSSIQRITDIANELQSKAKKITPTIESEYQRENVMISSLLESLITEKRIQLGLTTNIRIDLNLDKSYGLFANINTIEFTRALSNLIGNSLEAFDNRSHLIFVTVDYDEDHVIIRIEDDGKGIPEDVLDKVGNYGFSYGKEGLKSSGSGLGVHHALKTIASFGGTLSIDSKIKSGTSVFIKLPKVSPPQWFVSKIELSQIKLIVILDDDESIHNLWRDKLQVQKKQYNFEVKHFKLVKEFEHFFYSDLTYSKDKVLFLVDYEFVDQNTNGLKIIEKLHLERSSILVTSHHDDSSIRERTIASGVIRIIPKSIVSYIPLK